MPSTARLYAVLVTGALLLFGCAFPQQGTDTPSEIGGTYYVNGTDALEAEYGGQLIITPTDEADEFEMQWIITGSVQTGFGTWNGTTLDVEWNTVEGLASTSGTATYTLEDDGSLVGERYTKGRDGIGYEEAFPVRQ